MTKLEAKHIEFLQYMLSHRDEDLAKEAYDELKDIKAEFAAKGIIII